MIMVCDSREQRCLDFSGIEGIEKVETMALAYGDYTAIVHGSPVQICVERKNLQDLFGTMTSGYSRYKREMERARLADCKLILAIEGTYSDVWNGISQSQFDGQSMIKKLNTLYVKYDHEFWFCDNRRVMVRRISDLFLAIERNYVKENLSKISPTEVKSSMPLTAPQSLVVEDDYMKDSD